MGRLDGKPTWRNTRRCSSTSAFFVTDDWDPLKELSDAENREPDQCEAQIVWRHRNEAHGGDQTVRQSAGQGDQDKRPDLGNAEGNGETSQRRGNWLVLRRGEDSYR